MFVLATPIYMYLSLDLLWFHLPLQSWECSSWWVSLSCSILWTCPNHGRFIFMTISADDRSARVRTSSLVVLSYHLMLMMPLRSLIVTTCSLLNWALYIAQASALCKRVARRTARQTLYSDKDVLAVSPSQRKLDKSSIALSGFIYQFLTCDGNSTSCDILNIISLLLYCSVLT